MGKAKAIPHGDQQKIRKRAVGLWDGSYKARGSLFPRELVVFRKHSIHYFFPDASFAGTNAGT